MSPAFSSFPISVQVHGYYCSVSPYLVFLLTIPSQASLVLNPYFYDTIWLYYLLLITVPLPQSMDSNPR